MPSWFKFYLVYAGFRYAVIILGILHRYKNGQASDPLFASKIQNLPNLLINTSLKIINDIFFTKNTNIKQLS